MNAALITIGDELLIGQITNTNSAWMAKELSLAGIRTVYMLTVGDDKQAIIEAFDAARAKAEVVLITGGLGPTRDDITKNLFAEYHGVGLTMDEQVLNDVTSFFTSRGRTLDEVNRLQALVPEGCRVIRNRQGTAPGMWMERDGKIMVSMPGVPYEMQAMVTEAVIPWIKEKYTLPPQRHVTIITQGIGESVLAGLISTWEDGIEAAGLKLAYLPQPGMVRLRLSGYGTDVNELESLIEEHVQRLMPLIENYYCGRENYGDEVLSIERIIFNLLKTQGKTVAAAESCTGGYVSSLFTAMAGSSEIFKGAVVPYANLMKHVLLGVDKELFTTVGAVSREVVEQLAANVRAKFDADFAISVSGIAGPGGATPEKPVGTVWIAVADRNSVRARLFRFGNDRQRNIQMTAQAGLAMLRRLIEGLPEAE